jgi:hypothetical protein
MTLYPWFRKRRGDCAANLKISFAAACGKRFLTNARFAGQRFACPHCRMIHSVPGQQQVHEAVASRQRSPRARLHGASESSIARRIDGPRDRVWPWLCGGLAALACLALFAFAFQKPPGSQTQDIKQTSPGLPSGRATSATAAAPTPPIATAPVAVTTPVEDAAPPKQKPLRIKAPTGAPVQIVEWYPVNDASGSKDLTLLAVRVRLAASFIDSQERIADYRLITSTSHATALEGVGWNRLSAGTPLFVGASAQDYMERGLLFVVHDDDMSSGEFYFQYRKNLPLLLPRDRRLAPPASAAAHSSETQPTTTMPQTKVAAHQEAKVQPPSDWRDYLTSASGEELSFGAGAAAGGSSSSSASALSVTSTGLIALNWASLFGRFPHHHRWHDRDRDHDNDRDRDRDKDDDKVKKKSTGNGVKGPAGNGPNVLRGQLATPHFGQPRPGELPQHHIPTFRPMPGHAPFALSHHPAFRPPPVVRVPMGRRR